MPLLDESGLELGIGDLVQITGALTEVDKDPDFLNCVMHLDEPGQVTDIRLNTRQVEMTEPPTTPTELLDLFGREVGVGAEVLITGLVVGLGEEGAPVNLFVQLDALMPPSSTRIRIALASTQVQLTETALTQRRLLRMNEQIGEFKQLFRELYE